MLEVDPIALVRRKGAGEGFALSSICQSCEFREVDWGGCRCQAFALTGDAANTDPACALSPLHETIFKQAEREAEGETNRFLYRNFAGGTLESENGA